MEMPGFRDACAAWRAALGDVHVTVDDAACRQAATTTFATAGRILAILRPADRAQVQACMRIAHQHEIPVRPTSRGRNWGYGSRAPARDAVLLDLARLDRIVDFDERLAYVTVEPGVTFRQLATFLRDARARVFASVTGGPAEGSVVANALERGDGSGPLGDRIAHACGMEVVLATGECLETGFARFPGSPVAPLATGGVGPSLDGLFAQSDLGVVTRMTVWLAPYPAHFVLVGVTVDDDDELPAVVDSLRELRLAGVTPATTPLWNDVKALSLVTRYPWGEPFDRRALRRQHGFGAWNGAIALHATSRAHGTALCDAVRDKLGPVARLAFREGPEHPLDADPEVCGPHLGVPHDRNLASVYWRKRGPVGVDPDADRCGFLWLGHAIPFAGEHARTFADVVTHGLEEAGFEPAIALLGVTPRALSAVGSIAWDRDVAGEDERARDAHDRLVADMITRGYPPFRTGLQTPALVDPMVERLRGVLDPRGILTRG